MSDPKVPNPTRKDLTGYFDSTGDGGIRCIGAALSIDSNTHIVICAPDVIALKKAWAGITTQPINLKLAPILLYKYEPQPEKKEEFIRPVRPATKVVSQNYKRTDYCWWMSEDKCWIGFIDDSVKATNIGLACDMTATECKTLLRNFGLSRGEIARIEIDTIDPIPF